MPPAGVLFRVCRMCVRAVFQSRAGAVGCADMFGVAIGTLCAGIGVLLLRDTLSSGCRDFILMSILFVGLAIEFVICAVRRERSTLCCSHICCVSRNTSNSFASSDRCSLGVMVGRTQCCGNSWAVPEMRYAFVSGT
jgi:hypothetical protein